MNVVKINENEWMVTTAAESVIWIQKFGAGPTGHEWNVHDHIEGSILGSIGPSGSKEFSFSPDIRFLNSMQLTAIGVFLDYLQGDQTNG